MCACKQIPHAILQRRFQRQQIKILFISAKMCPCKQIPHAILQRRFQRPKGRHVLIFEMSLLDMNHQIK